MHGRAFPLDLFLEGFHGFQGFRGFDLRVTRLKIISMQLISNMGLAMSAPRADREGDVRRQYRTQYAYILGPDPFKAPRVQQASRKNPQRKSTSQKKKKQETRRLTWRRFDLMVLSRFPKGGLSRRYKHVRAQRKSLGPLLSAREKSLMRREIRWTGMPWSEV